MSNEFNKKEVKEYIIKLNVYFNALSILEYVLKTYVDHFTYKYNFDKDMHTFIGYYKKLASIISSFSTKYEKYVKYLGYEYYID